MTPHFDNALAKARKLMALAAADSGATAGERANALDRLRSLCTQHNIRPEHLDTAQRKRMEMELIIRSRPWKPTADPALLKLAAHCAAFITGEFLPVHWVKKSASQKTKQGRKSARKVTYNVASCDLTQREYDDWRACFDHYASLMLDTLAELRTKQRQIARALKQAPLAFIYKHDLFPETQAEPDSKVKPLSLAQIEALMDAMDFVQGSRWEKPTAALHGETLLLPNFSPA